LTTAPETTQRKPKAKNIATVAYTDGGRANQKRRTQGALLRATRDIVDEGGSPTVAQAALRALISEATAYRYYPDAPSLLREALSADWPTLDAVLQSIGDETDACARARTAAEALASNVLAHEARVRAMIAISQTSPQNGDLRPQFRRRLVKAVLSPMKHSFPAVKLNPLEQALCTIISAEAVLSLKTVMKTNEQQTIESVGWTAEQVMRGFLAQHAASNDLSMKSPKMLNRNGG
jgi:hypothetical protein